jgi:hypothetical protein
MNDLTAERLAASDILLLLSSACPVPDISPQGERSKANYFVRYNTMKFNI